MMHRAHQVRDYNPNAPRRTQDYGTPWEPQDNEAYNRILENDDLYVGDIPDPPRDYRIRPLKGTIFNSKRSA
jgi:hypothetical protein